MCSTTTSSFVFFIKMQKLSLWTYLQLFDGVIIGANTHFSKWFSYRSNVTNPQSIQLWRNGFKPKTMKLCDKYYCDKVGSS